jgi:hypothetical protein
MMSGFTWGRSSSFPECLLFSIVKCPEEIGNFCLVAIYDGKYLPDSRIQAGHGIVLRADCENRKEAVQLLVIMPKLPSKAGALVLEKNPGVGILVNVRRNTSC